MIAGGEIRRKRSRDVHLDFFTQTNAALLARLRIPGDYTCEETHVPIPNTPVKLTGPMIVPTSAKVGYCRDHSREPGPETDPALFVRSRLLFSRGGRLGYVAEIGLR